MHWLDVANPLAPFSKASILVSESQVQHLTALQLAAIYFLKAIFGCFTLTYNPNIFVGSQDIKLGELSMTRSTASAVTSTGSVCADCHRGFCYTDTRS